MADPSQIAIDSEFSIIKLKNSLEELSRRSENTSDANALLSETTALFKDFFDNLSDPEFSPVELKKGDTPRSKDYNDNLQRIYNDISRFYRELNNLTTANTKTFNFSQVVISEINKRAKSLSSMVLDLNILSNFTRGDVIVAGDDFINLENIDTSAALGSSQAEIISNGAGLSLARASTNNLSSNPQTKIEVIPISPATETPNGLSVISAPTPGNLKRFYEGNYYNFLGAARPEGGRFNIQFILDPSSVQATVVTEGETDAVPEKPSGTFLEYGASEEEKAQARLAMLDNNPDTLWECEYAIKLDNPLIPDVTEALILDPEIETPGEDNKYDDPESPTAAAIQINVAELNSLALSKDTVDLTIDLVVSFPEDQNINFVSINPVIYSKKAFVEVEDISTISSNQPEFRTVDNWDSIRFPKTITPEANEFLSDSQLSATLAPNRFNYTGQGIYPFPTRVANKVKIRLTMKEPAAQLYEKTYTLLKNTLDVKTTITTTTTKGRLRF